MAKGPELANTCALGRDITWVLLAPAFLPGCILSSGGHSVPQWLSKNVCLADTLQGSLPASQDQGSRQTQL